MYQLIFLLALLGPQQQSEASQGDRASWFRACVVQCPQDLCPLKASEDSSDRRELSADSRSIRGHETASLSTPSSKRRSRPLLNPNAAPLDPNWINPDPWMALMQWDCISECKYKCMVEYSATLKKMNLPTVKFYGKWPFTRVLGVQELFSSLASFLNGVPHGVYFFTPSLRRKYAGPRSHYMRIPLYVHSVIAMNSWLWSTVFHARDVPFTEACDYFFATMQLMFSMWMALYRMSRPPGGGSSKKKALSEGQEGHEIRSIPDRNPGSLVAFLGSYGVGLAFLTFYVYYVHSMMFTLFDYGWHMKINGVLVAFQAVAWLVWSVTLGKRRRYRFKAIGFLTLVLLAASCEVFDFPPYWGLIDAHATWHLLTAPMIPLWYSFWVDDTAFETKLAMGGRLRDN